jgi:O-antigen/teichoic acid export membrane protein
MSSSAAITTRAAHGAVWQMLGFVSLTGCSYVMVMLLARGLGPAAYSVYGVIYSTLLATELVLRLGVPQALTKLVAGASGAATRLEATGVTVAVSVNLVAFAAFWLVAPVLARLLNVPDGALLFRIAAIDLPFFALYTVLGHLLGGRREFVAGAVGTIGYAVTKVIGVVLLLATDTLSVGGALLVNVAASVVGLALLLPTAGAAVLRPTLAERAPILALALPVLIADFGVQALLGVDLWLLNALGGHVPAETKGHYVAALNLARVPNLLAFVLATVLIPSIAKAIADRDGASARRLVLGATRFLAVLVLPACALIAVNAREILALLFSEAYAPGAPYLALLIFAHGMGFTCLGALQSILLGAGKAAVGARRIYVGLAIALAVNVVLIPRFGADGAGTGAVLAFATATLLVGAAVRRRLGAIIEPRVALLAILASAGIGAVGWLIPAKGVLVLVELALLGLAHLGVAWLIGLIGKADLLLLRGKAPD